VSAPVEALGGADARLGAEPPRLVGRPEQPAHRPRQRLPVVDRNDQAARAVLDDLRQAARVGANDWARPLRRLQSDQPERLAPARRHDDDGGAIDQRRDITGSHPAGEGDGVCDAEIADASLERRPLGAVARDHQAGTGVLGANGG